jgi:hypothetical protein
MQVLAFEIRRLMVNMTVKDIHVCSAVIQAAYHGASSLELKIQLATPVFKRLEGLDVTDCHACILAIDNALHASGLQTSYKVGHHTVNLCMTNAAHTDTLLGKF